MLLVCGDIGLGVPLSHFPEGKKKNEEIGPEFPTFPKDSKTQKTYKERPK